MIASLIGVLCLIFCAKGNPLGQVFAIIFGSMYAVISFSYAYYGEMLTYLGMTVPMAIVALISWLKNPFKGNKAQVEVNEITKKEVAFMFALSLVVTVVFHFILKWFNTANLIFSTVSITTSFIAVYLTFRRTIYFHIAYAFNDVALIVLWVLATVENISYVSVVVCFTVFLINDIYGFINWIKMDKRQKEIK
jgi:nicotinamide mononucleotide transporter PnuC